MILKASVRRKNLILLIVILLAFTFPKHPFGQSPSTDSTKTLSDFLKKGELEFKSRTFFMSTLNEGSNRDYFALAQGAGVDYTTPSFYGFHFKMGGYVTFRLAEYNLLNAENEWAQNRYEKSLFDIKNPNNRHPLAGLEEIYLAYEYKGLHFKLGSQIHQTPLLNKNTNRIRPNLFQGLNVNYNYNKWKLSAAWFLSEHIRGTSHSFSSSNSFGVYGQGINPSGEASNYRGHISTSGIGVFGAQYNLDNWKTQAWNYVGENVFNLTFIQSDFKLKHNNTEYKLGLQGLYQTALNNGGNANQDFTYILKDEQSFAIGGKMAAKFIEQHEFSINYLGISDQGRYLFPREWGREIFYATQSREAFEGYGGLNAYTLKYKFNTLKTGYSLLLGAGLVDQPDIENKRLNKYSLDDYYHFTIDMKYKFKNYLKGMSIRFLAAYKKEKHSASMTFSEKHNKVNMINLNLIIDYAL
ncbi:hypothetical protein [Brumimicrobium oceani]|uniref:Outer membrane porin, OprD family n=1 Tax=Brumimicrobium oceani TaxID=2100725 RepID=A0A2U2X365_9FLAO|nr:hypothetical protein [Brumimicrobium oceani]PWH82223.1 hypothetical protein DIT68_14045 [Brumimicrobium oceani]